MNETEKNAKKKKMILSFKGWLKKKLNESIENERV